MSSRCQILAVLGAGSLATVAYSVLGGGGGMVARGLPWGDLSGEYEMRVRAYDLSGAAQSDRVQPNFPNGATGLHRVVVSVA